jgi:uncharacterized protein (TIGR02466 family)
MMQIKPWFSNFMAHSYLKEINNKKLEKYCLELKRTTRGRTFSNYLGWQSYDLSLETPALAPLLQAIRKEIPFFENLLSLKKGYNLKFINMWANINNHTHMNRPHDHPRMVLSGVYYVTAPPRSEELRFMNPHPANFDMINKIVDTWNVYNSGEVFFKPEPSKLVIFPGHLIHYVLPNQSKKNRISLSFNISVKEFI